MVREIKFRSRERFLDAAELLIKRRGLFNMLPGKMLSVNEEQYAALVAAGLVTKNGNQGRTGGRKSESKKPGRAAG
jgi:hypothetical protein